MAVFNWVITIVVTIIFAGLVAQTFAPRSVDRAVAKLARNVGLAIEPSVEPVIRRRVVRRVRLTTTAAAAALWAMVGVLVFVLPTIPDFSQAWLLAGAIFLGIGVGSIVSAITARSGGGETGMRVARPRAVTVADYLAPSERHGARLTTLGSVVILAAAVLTLALTGFPPAAIAPAIAAVALTVLAVLSLILFEVFGRRIVEQPQPAGSPAELAWDDALRSVALRDLVTAPIAVGLYGAAFGIATIAGALPFTPVAAAIVSGLVMCAFAGAVLGLVLSIAQKPQQHYLRRLWPEVLEAAH